MINNTRCQGIDTGYDNDPTSNGVIVCCGMDAGELSAIIHACRSMGASLSTAKDAMILLGNVFEEERKPMKDISLDFELMMREMRLEEIEENRYQQKDHTRPRVRLSVPQTHIRLSVSRPRIRLRMSDSRSGMKGKTIRRRLGKL